MSISTNDLKNGMALDLPEGLMTVIEFQHVKPGKGGAFVRTKLRRAADDYAPELDEHIGRHAKGWTVARIAPLEKAIMRVALLEMLHPDAVPGDHPIPAEGAIDEAVETAKTFCGAEAPGFVNGILAAVLREIHDNGRRR